MIMERFPLEWFCTVRGIDKQATVCPVDTVRFGLSGKEVLPGESEPPRASVSQLLLAQPLVL